MLSYLWECFRCGSEFVSSGKNYCSIECESLDSEIVSCDSCGGGLIPAFDFDSIKDSYSGGYVCGSCHELRVLQSEFLFQSEIWRECAESGRVCGVDDLCVGCSAFEYLDGCGVREGLYPDVSPLRLVKYDSNLEFQLIGGVSNG